MREEIMSPGVFFKGKKTSQDHLPWAILAKKLVRKDPWGLEDFDT